MSFKKYNSINDTELPDWFLNMPRLLQYLIYLLIMPFIILIIILIFAALLIYVPIEMFIITPISLIQDWLNSFND